MVLEKSSSIRNIVRDIEIKMNTRIGMHKLAETVSGKKEDSPSINKKLRDNVSITSIRSRRKKIITKIRKKLGMKTKITPQERELSVTTKSDIIRNSFECRMEELSRNILDKRVLNMDLILVDEEANRNEAILFQIYAREKILVKELVDKIAQVAKDPILRKKSYQSLCLDNGIVLEEEKPLQSYFLSTDQYQFAIAVPAGIEFTKSVELAMPVIQKIRSDVATNRKPSVLSKRGKEHDDLSKLLQAYQRDSLRSTKSATECKEICIPQFIYVIWAVVFIYIVHGSSNKDSWS